MIPSVQERKKNIHSFMESYPNLCRLQNTVPNPNIKVNSSNNFLDFVGDRLKSDDWKPLLEAISNDRSLHFISIRSKYNSIKVSQENVAENQGRQNHTPKSCASFTNDTVVKLTDALSRCLRDSAALTGLVLEKLPLGADSLNHLTQGLEVCRNLQQLSLPHCQIGDDGCASLCHVLRRRLNLVWLNLSGCGLTEKGIGMLCDLLKFQKLNRYGESWKQSLRYRPVNPNTMPGLRRLTLNHNPVGDTGVNIFVDTLVDDLWLKALDLQNCDITLIGGEQLLNLVKENQFLSVVDIRGNLQIPKSLVAAVVQQLAENNTDTTPEFQWLKEDNLKNSLGGSSRASVSRSSQRIVSNTTLSTKGRSILTILPSKARVSTNQPPTHWSRARSASAKRAQTTNNTPRPPWNSNLHSALRRGNSDQHIIHNNKKNNEDILLELNSVKEQLEDVQRQLEEETEKRMKIEKQLENYKNIATLPDNLFSADVLTVQKAFEEFYRNNQFKNSVESPVSKKDKKEVEQDKNHTDNLDYLIKTVNGENALNLHFSSNLYNSSSSHSSDNQNEAEEQIPTTQGASPSRAQRMFETLISS